MSQNNKSTAKTNNNLEDFIITPTQPCELVQPQNISRILHLVCSEKEEGANSSRMCAKGYYKLYPKEESKEGPKEDPYLNFEFSPTGILGDVISGVFLTFTDIPEEVYNTSLGVLNFIDYVEIFVNGVKINHVTNRQLKSYYEWINPESKSWKNTEYFPLPIPILFKKPSYYMISIRVKRNKTYTYPLARFLQIQSKSFLPTGGLYEVVPVIATYAAETYVKCHITMSPLTISLNNHNLPPNITFPYYSFTEETVFQKGKDQTVKLSLDWNYKLPMIMMCIQCEYKPRTNPEFPHLIKDNHPFESILVLCNNMALDISKDPDIWYKFDKVENGLRIPPEAIVYTHTFQKPKYIQIHDNTHLICANSSNIPSVISHFRSHNIDQIHLMVKWSVDVPEETRARVWGVMEGKFYE